MSKILILSASIGSGHMKAAKAIAETFDESVDVIDFMEKDASHVNFFLKKLYLRMLKLFPDLYDRIYRVAGVRQFGSITRLIWSTLMYLPFNRLLKQFNPNIIICTHPFPEAAASLWKFLHPKKAKSFYLIAVLTDYSPHEIWIYNEVDLYFVATEEMKLDIETHGNYKVIASGIPISRAFDKPINFQNTSLSNILIMGGGLGLGAFEETINLLEQIDVCFNITVVTGNNVNLQSKLMTVKSKHKIKILGFVDNIADLMQSADLLITKPGALTLTEAFAVGLPILLPPIPGPESENASFAIQHGAALSINDNFVEIFESLLNKPDVLINMRKNSFKLSRQDTAKIIHDVISDLK